MYQYNFQKWLILADFCELIVILKAEEGLLQLFVNPACFSNGSGWSHLLTSQNQAYSSKLYVVIRYNDQVYPEMHCGLLQLRWQDQAFLWKQLKGISVCSSWCEERRQEPC